MSLTTTLINTFLPERAATIQQTGHPAAGVIGWQNPKENLSGVDVTESSALNYAAVWCAVRVLSETLATLPCLLYRRTGTGKERARDDDRFFLVHDSPNDEQSAFTFFETGQHHLLLWGNAFARIIRGNGSVVGLETRLPSSVRVERPEADGPLLYKVEQLGEELPAEEMLHVPGLSFDGVLGMSVVKHARQSFGGAQATEKHAASYFGNGARPDGALKVPGPKLDKEARNALRNSWEEQHGGDKQSSIAILHGQMEYQPISMTNEDSQFIESRRFSVNEIARWFRIPPHMLADLDRATFSNVEQQALDFVQYSLTPWLRRWETTLNRKLLLPGERGDLFFEFLVDGLLRGDVMSRKAFYESGLGWGYFSIDEVRGKENMNPLPGGQGEEHRVPLNTVPVGQEPELVPDTAAKEFQENISRMVQAVVSNNEDTVMSLRSDRLEIKHDIETLGSRVQIAVKSHLAFEREKQKIVVAAKRQDRGESFLGWLDRHYTEDHPHRVALLACTDGPPGTFVERVTACVEGWEE